MQTKKVHRSSSKNKLLLRLVLGVLVILVAATIYYFFIKSGTDASEVRPVNTVDYSSPTEEEIKETEDFKQKQQAENNRLVPPSPNVTPIISYVGQYDAAIEASGFVSSILEDGGTCTLTVTKNDVKISKSVSAQRDAQTTKCDLFMFPAKELIVKGEWSATITYESASSSGTSEPMKFEVR